MVWRGLQCPKCIGIACVGYILLIGCIARGHELAGPSVRVRPDLLALAADLV